MNEPAPATAAADPTSRQPPAPPASIPADTTPTWQVELLLSGGVVFALLQLPARLDGAFDWARPRLDEAWWEVAIFLFLYTKVAVLAMISAFVAHLALRTLWVALIGLDSVYPQGIRWQATRHGPVSRELAEADAQPLRTAAARIDNLATLVFATGAVVTAMSLSVLLTTLLLLGLGQTLAALVPAVDEDDAVLLLLVVVIAPSLLAFVLDRLFGRSLAPAGPGWRLVRSLHLTQRLFTPARSLRQMLLVLTSNLGRWRGSAVVIGLFYVLATVVAVDLLRRTGSFPLDRYTYVARGDGPHAVLAEHYRSRRADGARYSLLPSIAAPVVEGHWIELFVPFHPRLHPSRLAARCPEVAAAPVAGSEDRDDRAARAAEAARRAAALDCLAGVHPVSIDELPLADLRWDFYTDPDTQIAGMLVMIPVRDLAPGRHELAIARIEEARAGDSDAAEEPAPWRIPFWR